MSARISTCYSLLSIVANKYLSFRFYRKYTLRATEYKGHLHPFNISTTHSVIINLAVALVLVSKSIDPPKNGARSLQAVL